jgi:hypothetical protein
MYPKAGGINVEVSNASLVEALDQCFKDQPLTYKIFQETIVVKKKDTADLNARLRLHLKCRVR